MTGYMKTVSIVCTESPILHFDFTTPKGSLQAKPNRRELKIKERNATKGR